MWSPSRKRTVRPASTVEPASQASGITPERKRADERSSPHGGRSTRGLLDLLVNVAALMPSSPWRARLQPTVHAAAAAAAPNEADGGAASGADGAVSSGEAIGRRLDFGAAAPSREGSPEPLTPPTIAKPPTVPAPTWDAEAAPSWADAASYLDGTAPTTPSPAQGPWAAPSSAARTSLVHSAHFLCAIGHRREREQFRYAIARVVAGATARGRMA
jgi:hypothetical protein